MSRKFALFIGNSEYDSESLSNLKSPTADVQDLANLFRDSSIGGFDEVTELINSTESQIRQKISNFFLRNKPEDLLLLYFSGHGILDDSGDLYLAAKDTQPDLLRATAISSDFIAEDMDRCRSKRQVLILDCCHSGAFRRGMKGDEKVLTAATFKGNGSGRVVLTASDRREYAMEGNQILDQAETSLFTHFLLEGLKSGEADRDGDSLITLDEWYDYAYDKVVEYLPTQTPRRWVYNQEGRVIIARNPKPIKSAELAWELREAIRDKRSSVRYGATTELAHLLNSRNKRLALAAREALQNLQKDDTPEVREAADRILAGDDSVNKGKTPGAKFPVPDSMPGSVGVWNKLWLVLTNFTASRWKPWLIAAPLSFVVILAGWGVFIRLGNDTAVVEESSFSAEQADLGAAGVLEISPELPEHIVETQEASPISEESSDIKEESPGEYVSADQQRVLTTHDEQKPKENGNETDNSAEPEAQNNEQQELPPLILNEEPVAEAEENPAETGDHSLDWLISESIELQRRLEQAYKDRQWKSIPALLEDYYYRDNKMVSFYSVFNIIEVESTAGELQSDEATATLPVTVHISYQQKGREDQQNLSIPANWVWEKGDDGFVLSKVYRP